MSGPSRRRPAVGLTWRHWALVVLGWVAIALVVAALLTGWNAAARAGFIGAVVAALLVSLSLVPRRTRR